MKIPVSYTYTTYGLRGASISQNLFVWQELTFVQTTYLFFLDSFAVSRQEDENILACADGGKKKEKTDGIILEQFSF